MNQIYLHFQNSLEKCKNKVAVGYWDDLDVYKTLTFNEVHQLSIDISDTIESVVKGKCVCLGLCMIQNPYIPSLILSLQKCGITFIFLDPHVPDECLKYVDLLNLKWIISDSQTSSLNFLQKHATLQTTFEDSAVLKLWKTNCVNETIYEQICFIICTSGTTGEPKIVKVEHECIVSNIMCLSQRFALSQDDVIYFGTPLTFDPSIVELFLALFNSCTLLIAPPKVKLNPSLLLQKLFPEEHPDRSVTLLQIVPSLFLRWKLAEIEYILQKSTCRVLAFGGEIFPKHILKIPRSENIRIYNLYGITEVSCWASCYAVKNCDEDIPLGEPLDETMLEVRDNNGSVITCGEGELFIGSFSRICYLNQEKSLQKPVYRSSGDLVKVALNDIFYVSRKKCTVKRFGIKVDLVAIERIVLEKANLQNICLWLENKNKLICFVVIAEFNPITKQKIVDKLRVKLLHSLPKHYYPDHIEVIPNIPTTKHGKIDRKSLEELYNKLAVEKSENPLELFKLLWIKYLGINIEEIERYDANFFESGGNSISAIQFLSEFQELTEAEFSNELTVLLFEKTLKSCCDFISGLKAVPRKRKNEYHEQGAPSKIQVEHVNSDAIRIKIAWKYNLEACVDDSPVIIKLRNSTLVTVGSFSHIFAAFDCETGALVSKVILPDNIEGSCCFSTSTNKVYVGCYDGKMYCIDITSCNILWEYSTGNCIKSAPCICLQDEALCFGSYDKSVHCINIKTADLIWKTDVNGSVACDVLYDNGSVYVATTFGNCACLNEVDGTVLWKHNVGAPIFGSPIIFSCDINCIVWPDVCGKLHSFSISQQGKKKWTFKADGNIYCSLKKHKNFLLFGCHDHNFYCLQVKNDNCCLIYKVLLDSAINSAAHILQYNDEIYVVTATNFGNVYLLHLNSGAIVASLGLPDKVYSSPTILDNKIYIGCRDNNLYCLNIVK